VKYNLVCLPICLPTCLTTCFKSVEDIVGMFYFYSGRDLYVLFDGFMYEPITVAGTGRERERERETNGAE